jgi:hypothetical protein
MFPAAPSLMISEHPHGVCKGPRLAWVGCSEGFDDLRTMSRKQEVHGVATSTDRVHRRVDGPMVDQSFGCSIGCSGL